MIALDTNVLVRFLVQDDAAQGQAAADLVGGLTEQEPGYICREVIIELIWVLERAYKMTRAQIIPAIEGLLASRELVVEHAGRVGLALSRYVAGGAGFSDQMIRLAAEDAGCEYLVTFDRALAREQTVQLLKA
ncbi:PIN domain-containing protein [Ruegeria sp. EL01]|uniref:PIN domain-containing protein n=1 Tax=Ruegeria sp. EL01 TaxID=2107578 RepID=UPI000EA82031|nr:type II toxin-antitoxin system VapC family toxin [Ruegeria sp. EL01]